MARKSGNRFSDKDMRKIKMRGRWGDGAMNTGEHQHKSWGARLVLLVPYVWLAVFFLVPFLIVLKISLSHTAIAQPPYEPVFDPAAGWAGFKAFLSALSFENYAFIASDWLYLGAYLKSLEVAGVSTFLLLVICFPLAYGIGRAPRRWQPA